MQCSVADCSEPVNCRGWCLNHYNRWRRHGDPDHWERGPKALSRRFWSKVEKTSRCWLWTGYCQVRGHGSFYLTGRMRPAHRVAWMLTHGELPPSDVVVRHTCGNASCVRPDHLTIGSVEDNNRDQVVWNRAARRLIQTHRDQFDLLLAEEQELEEGMEIGQRAV